MSLHRHEQFDSLAHPARPPVSYKALSATDSSVSPRIASVATSAAINRLRLRLQLCSAFSPEPST